MLCAYFGGLEAHEVFEEAEEVSVFEAGVVLKVNEADEVLEVDRVTLESLNLLYFELLLC